ncbi:MAG: hypothetical protein R6U27_02235 [Desulfobacterales bacterium]
MKKFKFLLSSVVFFIAVTFASLSFGGGRPLFIMVWDEYGAEDPYYILVKFDQNQFAQNEAEALSQFVVGMAAYLPADDYGMNYAALSPNELAGYGLGDADYVKQIMTSAGWDYAFIDLTMKPSPAANATNYNMDIFYYDAADKLNTYILSLGIPNYWLAYIN